MNPKEKRFLQQYGPVADAIALLDIDQEVREQVADALTRAFARDPYFKDFRPHLFQQLASDPLCLCAGTADAPCPNFTLIRVSMHFLAGEINWIGGDHRSLCELGVADQLGRSEAWQPRKPIVRCVDCGAKVAARKREG